MDSKARTPLDAPMLLDTGERVTLTTDGWTWTTEEGVRHVCRRRWPAVRAAAVNPVFRLAETPEVGLEHQSQVRAAENEGG